MKRSEYITPMKVTNLRYSGDSTRYIFEDEAGITRALKITNAVPLLDAGTLEQQAQYLSRYQLSGVWLLLPYEETKG